VARRPSSDNPLMTFLGFLAAGCLSASCCETARLAPTCPVAAVAGPKISLRPLRVGEFSPDGLTVSRGPFATVQSPFGTKWHKNGNSTLDRFGVFGEAYLRYLVSEYMLWYHESRTHQSLDRLSKIDGNPR